MGTSISVGRGTKWTISPKLLAFLVILCFEKWRRKQNTVALLKSKDLPAPNLWASYAARYAQRQTSQKTGLPGSHKQKRPDQPVKRAHSTKKSKYKINTQRHL